MKPVFPRINKAIDFTIEYYTKAHIIDYMQAYTRIAKGHSAASYLFDNWEKLVYRIHDDMEAEILQIVYTSNQNTQVIMFEELRSWLEIDWRLEKDPNINFLWKVVDEYNEKEDLDLRKRVEIEVDKFCSTEEFKNLGENEEYNKKVFALRVLGAKGDIEYTERAINRKYYCNNLTADFLDYYQFNQYTDLVARIVKNFREKIEKHLSLFDAGKYVPLSEITVQKKIIDQNDSTQKLLESSPQKDENQTKKLQTSLNGEQLLYFFQKLLQLKVIQADTQKEICEFIANNFYATTNGRPSNNISADRLAKIWNTSEAKTAGHLKDIFIALMNASIKDNPNGLK